MVQPALSLFYKHRLREGARSARAKGCESSCKEPTNNVNTSAFFWAPIVRANAVPSYHRSECDQRARRRAFVRPAAGQRDRRDGRRLLPPEHVSLKIV